ncbi:MAG: ABC-three component system protein [Waterburya sp.]
MDCFQQRKKDLEDNLNQDYELLKESEDQFRIENDPKNKKKLQNDIKKLKQTIKEHEPELDYIKQLCDEKSKLTLAMTQITFKELEIVTKAISCMSMPLEIDFQITPPREKIIKNKLSSQVQSRLMTGMLQAKLVEEFIKDFTKYNPEFPETLRAGFIEKYYELKNQGKTGDDLFYSLHEFSSNYDNNYDSQAAGLAVLYYLFERCDIFEK